MYFWEDCELARSANVANVPFNKPEPAKTAKNIEVVELGVPCPKCQKNHKIKGYVNLTSIDVKNLNLPTNPLIKEKEILICDTPGCGLAINLKPIKNMVENQLKKKITLI